jgi:hypothetical protein
MPIPRFYISLCWWLRPYLAAPFGALMRYFCSKIQAKGLQKTLHLISFSADERSPLWALLLLFLFFIFYFLLFLGPVLAFPGPILLQSVSIMFKICRTSEGSYARPAVW